MALHGYFETFSEDDSGIETIDKSCRPRKGKIGKFTKLFRRSTSPVRKSDDLWPNLHGLSKRFSSSNLNGSGDNVFSWPRSSDDDKDGRHKLINDEVYFNMGEPHKMPLRPVDDFQQALLANEKFQAADEQVEKLLLDVGSEDDEVITLNNKDDTPKSRSGQVLTFQTFKPQFWQKSSSIPPIHLDEPIYDDLIYTQLTDEDSQISESSEETTEELPDKKKHWITMDDNSCFLNILRAITCRKTLIRDEF